MVIVTGKYPQAQLVGLRGLGSLSPLPEGIQARVDAISPSIQNQRPTNFVTTTKAPVPTCVPGVSAPCTCADGKAGTKACGTNAAYAACDCTKPMNWLLYGGIALAAVVAWRVLR